MEKQLSKQLEKQLQKLSLDEDEVQIDKQFHELLKKQFEGQLGGKSKIADQCNFEVKITLIGDFGVGKTNILSVQNNQGFQINHIPTICVDFKIKTINIDGVKIKMQIWDTAGQQKFRVPTQFSCKGAIAIVLVYSVIERKSFQSVQNWMKQFNQKQYQKTCKLIVGNKCDVSESEKQVSYQEGKKLADQYGVKFIECSAKQNINISQIFMTIAEHLKDSLL